MLRSQGVPTKVITGYVAPNDLYPLPGETFRLYYKSLCTDQQTIDIYIVDSFGQIVTKSFSFNNETEEGGGDDGAEPDLPY